jgi:hypothetical protein
LKRIKARQNPKMYVYTVASAVTMDAGASADWISEQGQLMGREENTCD